MSARPTGGGAAGQLDGKVAIVTGGARGMGASHARRLVAEGAQVVVGDLLDDDGMRLAQELGDRCRFVHHDVTSSEDWQTVVDVARDAFGGLDILVSNAGVLTFESLDAMTPDAFRRIIEVNLVSQWLGLKQASAAMRPGGSVVNISSVNGIAGGKDLTAYSASKFGIVGLTKSAAIELGPKDIRVNSVHPGGVSTPMVGRHNGSVDTPDGPMSRVPIPRLARVEEITEMVLFLASDRSTYVTGSQFVVDGGMTAGAIG